MTGTFRTGPARRSTSAATLRASIGATRRTLAGYRMMRTIAEEHGMEYELERIGDLLVEYAQELDDLVERAAALGLTPDDFD